MPAAAYVLLWMMQPFLWIKRAPEEGYTIGHHLSIMEVKGHSKGKYIKIT